MVRPHRDHIVVIGAGAAGLLAAHELVRAGEKPYWKRETDAAGASLRFRLPIPDTRRKVARNSCMASGVICRNWETSAVRSRRAAYHRRAVLSARIKHLVTSRSQERMHLF
jgi:predicted oxidoreductase